MLLLFHFFHLLFQTNRRSNHGKKNKRRYGHPDRLRISYQKRLHTPSNKLCYAILFKISRTFLRDMLTAIGYFIHSQFPVIHHYRVNPINVFFLTLVTVAERPDIGSSSNASFPSKVELPIFVLFIQLERQQ